MCALLFDNLSYCLYNYIAKIASYGILFVRFVMEYSGSTDTATHYIHSTIHVRHIRLILLIPNAYFVHVRITKTMEKWLAITEFRLSGCAINFRNIMKTLAGGMAQTVWPSVISDWNKERKGKRNLQQ